MIREMRKPLPVAEVDALRIPIHPPSTPSQMMMEFDAGCVITELH
jgi:hypothetical protein